MNWEIRDLFSDLELVKEKIEDLKTAHVWFGEEYFKYASSNPLTKEQVLEHGYKYREHAIHNTQHLDLLGLYLNEFDELIKKFHEIEKASSVPSDQTKTDNAE
ncbi:type II toxin-antitoxin system toxin TscT [Staphylococcus borealis]|uniref:type II toxin-antitoxin system toxin TscT n=1 Tax=Staphylococcus borealis TaxID=2742203 RepID=UPI0039ECE501